MPLRRRWSSVKPRRDGQQREAGAVLIEAAANGAFFENAARFWPSLLRKYGPRGGHMRRCGAVVSIRGV